MIEDRDHREAGKACKSESARNAACVRPAVTVFRRSTVKQLTGAPRRPRYPRLYAGRPDPRGWDRWKHDGWLFGGSGSWSRDGSWESSSSVRAPDVAPSQTPSDPGRL